MVVAVKTFHVVERPTEPTVPGIINMQDAKAAVKKYHESGQYEADIWDLVGTWRDHYEELLPTLNLQPFNVQEVHHEVASKTEIVLDDPAFKVTKKVMGDKKYAVVFDADETLISNWEIIIKDDFGYIPKLQNDYEMLSSAVAIPPMKSFYKYLQDKNVHIVMLTGRHEDKRNATALNLERQDFTDYDMLLLRDETEYKKTAGEYKLNRRKWLTEEAGYTIIGCAGDQVSDCVGGYTGYNMKLPNYAYKIN